MKAASDESAERAIMQPFRILYLWEAADPDGKWE
jgi:hypothetical protein